VDFTLRSISWKYKLGIVSAIPFLVGVSMGCLSSYIVYHQSNVIKSKVETSVEHQTIVSSARVAIVDFERAVQAVIAADSADDIRQNSITVIRASSFVDEALQNLKQVRPDDRHVDSLQKLLLSIKPAQMRIVMKAKYNLDAAALKEVEGIKADLNRINRFAKQVLNDELTELQISVRDYYDHVSSTNYSLQLILFICFGIGFYLFRRLVQLLLTPLSNMTAQVAEISSGNLESRVKVTSTDELGVLGDGFNNMAKKLSELFDELEKSRDKALGAEQAKSQFLANMSHEIRTPMNAIIGFTSLMLRQDMQDKHKEQIKFIDNASRSLLRIINDILDLTKLNTRSMDVENIEFNLEHLLNAQMMAFSVLGRERDIELILSLDDDVPHRLLGDPNRTNQILTNLLGNALKFTTEGEVELTVAVETQANNDVCIVFSLRDTGAGIAAEYLPTLFDCFTQEDASTARRFGGSGLGLSIVKKLVDLLGGEIQVNSTVDLGSTFSFSLPFSVVCSGEGRRNPVSFDSITSLVINRNEAAARSIVRYLDSWKVSSTVVRSITAAQESLQRQSFDVLLLDENAVKDVEKDFAVLSQAQHEGHRAVVLYSCFAQLSLKVDISPSIALDKPLKARQLREIVESIYTGTLGLSTSKNHLQLPLDQPSENPLQQKRVLVVDDIKANQVLAAAMLDDLGFETDVADTGKSAIEMVNKAPFDLVLMDVNMPIMGGLEATAIIRKDLQFDSLPIVALTANAMVGFKKQCQEAGMNDYISKPFEIEQLENVLNKWLVSEAGVNPSKGVLSGHTYSNHHAGDTVSGVHTASQLTPSGGEINQNTEYEKMSPIKSVDDQRHTTQGLPESLPGIDIKSGLRRWQGKTTLYARQLGDFCDDYVDSADKIKQLVENDKLEELKFISHTVKGRAGSLSMHEVADAAAAIEQLLNQSQPLTEKPITVFENELRTVIESEGKFRILFEDFHKNATNQSSIASSSVSQKTTSLKVENISDQIQLFSRNLQQCNIKSKEDFNSLKPDLEKCQGISKQLGELELAMKRYCFDDAHNHLLDIAREIKIPIEILT
jgi:signal transduction histidine kinase/CheY-like chemotaxis protein/HPt (histidine-containing phosphotransfer) domain-containing protein